MIPEHLWADDLTGAAEIAHLLARRTGRPVRLALRAGALLDDGPHVRDLDLRHRHPDEARATLARELTGVVADQRVFLKIDSQLHGPVGGYLAAFVERDRAVVLSAVNPALGRVTLNGVHHVPTDAGVERTDLAVLLAGVRHRLLPSGGTGALAAAGAAVQAVDAATSADLAAIAQRTGSLDVAGSAAMLDALLGEDRSTGIAIGTGYAAGAAPETVLAVVGSTEPMARRQVAEAAARGVRVLTVDDPACAPEPAAGSRRGPLVLTRAGADATALTALADRAAAVLGELDPSRTAVLLTGGHTARLVLDRLGVAVLTAPPAAPSAVARMTTPSGLTVLTKPGSYGGPDTLATLLHEPDQQPHEVNR